MKHEEDAELSHGSTVANSTISKDHISEIEDEEED